MLKIKDLQIAMKNKIILNNFNFKIGLNEIHAIMGPNGSGKSTFSATLAGNEKYKVLNGSMFFNNKDLMLLSPEERAGEGIFVAFQYPAEIPGVNNQFFLQTAINSIRKYRNLPILDRYDLSKLIEKALSLLKIEKKMLNRFVNVDFSGGEKKRNDILQMILLEPKLCILDETDSGLDIDALRIVANGINQLRDGKRSFIIITHYKRILEYIRPDVVHILYNGKILVSDNLKLVKKIEEKGYEWLIRSR
ncbi:Fe-S cluster assembly ATPase SufC [Candidatus Tachikawaea gelatinosa]|uniref:Cysteine desulfurase ATPase component n=1 Tax=Candidatus Tachikawaea gelatinosa TaxID=1410383 RepID=A0A090AJP2_9ENTR|nr:Fe-S cluster assembly ATPase SufC [Candidatus Tachikawaea gelatinosa]BAP58668.1 cysteine desulfurase ATPase component [Candidatus Tachikawaea gelatinosa]